jgi:enoyl-CoA hydratase/carnithine racemase
MTTPRLGQIQQHLSTPQDLVLTSYSPDDRIVTITINNAPRANCLSTPVLRALLAAFASINPSIELDASVDKEDPVSFGERVCQSHAPNTVPRVVILKSNGKIFCSGHDLREFYGKKEDDYPAIRDIFELCNKLMLTIHRLPQIVISQVSSLPVKD